VVREGIFLWDWVLDSPAETGILEAKTQNFFIDMKGVRHVEEDTTGGYRSADRFADWM
jgi:hypothetical protein